MRTKSLPSCFFIVSLALLTTVAEAQPPAPGTSGKPVLARPLAEAMTKKARELFSDGTQAAAQGRLADALAAFTGADALSPHYSNKCNLGDVELRLGMFVDAAGHMRTCSRGLDGDARATAAEREGAKKIYEAAKTKVAEIAITTNVEGAQVTLGAAVLGKAPLAESVFVEPGKVAAKATLDGYQDAKMEVEGKAGQVAPVTLTLVKRVEPVPTSSAVPTSSPTAPPIEARPMWPAFVIGGAGAAGLIAGVAMMGVSSARKGDAEKLRDDTVTTHGVRACATDALPACKQQRDALGDASTLFNAGTWALIGAGVAAAGTLTYVLVSRKREPTPVQAGLVIAPSGGGAVIQGRF